MANSLAKSAQKKATKPKKTEPRNKDLPLALVLVLPTVLWVFAIVLYPMLNNIALSLGMDQGSISLEYYQQILSNPDTWIQLGRTLTWTAGSLVIIIPLGLGIAVLLNQEVPGLNFVRTWILLPWMFPVIVVVLIWRWMLEPNVGVSNFVLVELGIVDQSINFLSIDYAMWTVILVNAWRWIPFVVIVLLAALQNVPKELHEAAAIDGATSFRRFLHITVPNILPALLVNTFIIMMWLFNMFPPIWLMTRGGPSHTTTTLPIELYRTAFELFDLNQGAALAVFLFVFVVIFAAIYWKLSGMNQAKGERD